MLPLECGPDPSSPINDSPDNRKERLLRRRRIRRAQLCVLFEQEKQWDEEDCVDPDVLALKYAKNTREASLIAHKRALESARE